MHVQRIVGLLHVQAGDRPPAAADGVERPPRALAEPRHLRHRLVDQRLRLLDLVAGGIDEPQAADGKRRRLLQAVGGDVDQFEAAAAEIARDAVGLDEAHHDALGDELGFLLARQDLDA